MKKQYRTKNFIKMENKSFDPEYLLLMGVQVDDEDLHLLRSYAWRIKKKGYVACNVKGETLFLHRLILKALPGEMIDHKDRNPKNCKKENLRKTDYSGNRLNSKVNSNSTTGVKGVWFEGFKYRARVTLNGVHINLGSFSTLAEAEAAYKKHMQSL